MLMLVLFKTASMPLDGPAKTCFACATKDSFASYLNTIYRSVALLEQAEPPYKCSSPFPQYRIYLLFDYLSKLICVYRKILSSIKKISRFMMLRILLLCNGNAYVDIVCCHETMYFALSLVFLI